MFLDGKPLFGGFRKEILMAILSDILTFSRKQAKTDSNGLTDASGIVFANEALSDFHLKLIERGIDASQLQEAYRDGAVNVGTYLYPTDLFFLKAIELNYQDTSPENYKRASQVDVSNLQSNMSFGWLRKNGSTLEPQFDDRGDWYEIFPTPVTGNNVSQLIRLFYFLKPTDYSATSDTVSYPESLDYRIIGWRIAADYLYSLATPASMAKGDVFDAKYEDKVNRLVKILGRGTQQPTQAKQLGVTGFEF